jgi:ligand-binding SRPBCC domain-containing protein
MARLFVLRDSIPVNAPIERCFRLSTSIELVASQLRMLPVAGRISGLAQAGDRIRWRGRKFGMNQFHESLIEEFHPYRFFRDRMVTGRFRTFEHDHAFTEQADGSVLMQDEVRFSMRWHWCGELLGHLVLKPHIRALMRGRFLALKQIAESGDWRQHLETPHGEPGGSTADIPS